MRYVENPNYRVTRTDETGDYDQQDYRSLKGAQAKLSKWANEVHCVSGEKLTLTIEVF